MKWIRYLLLFVFTSWSLFVLSAAPENVIVFKQGCRPETDCRTSFNGREKDFSLRWKSYREGLESFLELKIEGDTFHISISPDMVRSHPFPFHLFIFSDSMKLYGAFQGGGSGGVFINYFFRDQKGRFHYVGWAPFLIYDEKTGYFVGGEKASANEHITTYYKLEGTSLVLKKTLSSLDKEK